MSGLEKIHLGWLSDAREELAETAFEMLSEADINYLRVRGVHPTVAMARGYQTANTATDMADLLGDMRDAYPRELTEYGEKLRAGVLMIPLHHAGQYAPSLYQMRPQKPRELEEVGSDGKKKRRVLKFELPSGAQRGTEFGELPVGDVHPLISEDGVTPLLMTEGVVKGDAILSAAYREGYRLVISSVTGVTMPYEAADARENPTGRRRLHPALLAQHPLAGRTVILAWDADWATNRSVGSALVVTGRLMEAEGATVYILDTPPLVDSVTGALDGKAGIDDLLASGMTLGSLLERLITVDEAARRTKRYEHSDLGRAQRLVDEMTATGSHRFAIDRGRWLAWDGCRWESRRGTELTLAATLSLRDKDDVRGRAAAGIKAAVELAAVMPEVQVDEARLDSDGTLLNTPTGTVDLATGELLPHDPAHLITRITTAGFDPKLLTRENFGAPNFMRVLREAFGGDEETMAWVQRWAGMAAIGTVREDILIQAQGVAGAGKSTIFQALVRALGSDYAAVLPPKMLTGDGASDEELATLCGYRLVVFSETEAGVSFHGSTLKQVAGREPISARHLYRDRFVFTPSHSAVLMTNHRPSVRGDDAAIWRRMFRLPFEHAVPVERRDPDLDAKLDAEAEGILAWMVAGAMSYLQERRLGTCAVVEAASLAYRAEQDVIGAFVSDCLDFSPELRMPRADLYEAFCAWSRDEGRAPWTRKALMQALEERGCAMGLATVRGTRYLTGVGLSNPRPEVDF